MRDAGDLLSANRTESRAVLAAQWRHRHSHRPVLLYRLLQIEEMALVDPIRLFAAFWGIDATAGHHVDSRHVLFFKSNDDGDLNRSQAAAALGFERAAHLTSHEDAVRRAVGQMAV